MGGEQKPFRWIALFRDGHTIEQSAVNDPSAFQSLKDYLYGTIANPKKHYLLWFRITNGDDDFTVSFDRDGDAYIDTPDGKCHMTEMKIRSAHLLYHREYDRATATNVFSLGFGGINTLDEIDGKCLQINDDGSYNSLGVVPIGYAMIKIENVKEQPHDSDRSMVRR